MKARLALMAFAPLCALAQLQTFVLDRPLGSLYDFGPVASGDTLDIVFRVRNQGTAAATLQTITVGGTGFSLSNYPPLPYTIAPGLAAEFSVRFAPPGAGAYSANLGVNGAPAVLRGTGVLAPQLYLDAEGAPAAPLRAGTLIDFGRAERGSAAARRFRIENPTGGWMSVGVIRVEGARFTGPLNISAPLLLDARASVPFEIRFEPLAAGLAEGTLEIDGRRFPLRGAGAEIPFPRPAVVVDAGPFASAQQGNVRVEFSAPSRVAGSGELRVEFRSAVAGVAADPAILLLPMTSRFAPFSVKEGDTRARFGDRDSLIFQTGTTAGTLVLTAKIGDQTDQVNISIAGARIELETVKAVRSGSQVELQIVGFDNVRTAGPLAFTFYDARDAVVAPGVIRVDAAPDFRRYFENSAVGGAFALRAVFPLSGNSAEVTSVDVELGNSLGTTRPARIRLP